MLTIAKNKYSAQTVFRLPFFLIISITIINIGKADIDIEIIADADNEVLATSGLPQEDFSG